MTMQAQVAPHLAAPSGAFDWHSAIGDALKIGLACLIREVVRAEMEARAKEQSPYYHVAAPLSEEAASEAPAMPDATDPATEAASLLGVSVDASEEEVRAALRARLSASRLHPDHGGDGEHAKKLIAARNLLVERARAAKVTR